MKYLQALTALFIFSFLGNGQQINLSETPFIESDSVENNTVTVSADNKRKFSSNRHGFNFATNPIQSGFSKNYIYSKQDTIEKR